jgi:hypothetical protein
MVVSFDFSIRYKLQRAKRDDDESLGFKDAAIVAPAHTGAPEYPSLVQAQSIREGERLGGLDKVDEAQVLLDCLNLLTIATPLAKSSHSFRCDEHRNGSGVVCRHTHRKDGKSPVFWGRQHRRLGPTPPP